MLVPIVLNPYILRDVNLHKLVRKLIFLLSTTLAFAVHADATKPKIDELEQGRRIYQDGILGSGAKLKGLRFDNTIVEEEAAACVKCHRKSGMGTYEGGNVIPPVTGPFLFPGENRPIALMDPHISTKLITPHDSYTDKSLAKVIRQGLNKQGAKINAIMPHYSLGDADMKALIRYLKQLSSELSPGVGSNVLNFATVITPGVDPKERDVLLKMIRTAFVQRNASQQPSSGRMRMGPALLPHTLRDWELKVWELQGPPETWGGQLEVHYKREPVFAMISGLSNTTWAPVHEFCQHEQLPCLFPSVDLPQTNEAFYSMYLSRGVILEADVLAKYLIDKKSQRPQRLIQVYRQDDVTREAAQALAHALSGSGIVVEDRILNKADPEDVGKVLEGIEDKDSTMFWLRSDDVKVLDKLVAKKAPDAAYFSGQMVEGDAAAIPASWRPTARLVYPYEIGEKRRKNLLPLKGWLSSLDIPLVNETIQSDVYLNMILLDDLATLMLDNVYRNYFVERAEDILSTGADITAYPHLSLAPGQRFASKGGYIVRYDGDKLVAESDWIVP